MGRIAAGAGMILFVLVINILVAFILTEAGGEAGSVSTACGDYEPTDNTTADFEECNSRGRAAFLGSFLAASVSGIPGAPSIFNILYVTILGSMLILGVILVATGFIPFTSE